MKNTFQIVWDFNLRIKEKISEIAKIDFPKKERTLS